MLNPLSLAAVCLVSSTLSAAAPADWQRGKLELTSIGELACSPDGVLFVSDPQASTVYALKLGPASAVTEASFLIESPEAEIADLLGTASDDLLIHDLVVDPQSGDLFLSVSRGRGADSLPVLIRIDGTGDFEAVSLADVEFQSKTLVNPPLDQPDARRNPRTLSITDLVFTEGRLYVAGLSNEEFASNLRSYAFPFDTKDAETPVEIYHGNHGAYETHAPVRTFLPYEIEGVPHIVAAYTCTPLVTFPVATLEPGKKVRGKTIAELGGGNVPLDMVAYEKDGVEYLLIANSRRGVMKMKAADIGKVEAITAPVNGTHGLSYETLAELEGVQQLATAPDGTIVALLRDPAGLTMLANIDRP